MKSGCVYLATNTTNGRAYIGKSKLGLAFRRGSHVRYAARQSSIPFSSALAKYGADAFEWAELYVSDDDRALVAAEIQLIAAYRSAGVHLYNVTDGGEGSAGRKRPEHELAEMRTRRIGEQQKEALRSSWTPQRKAAQAEKMRNRVVTEASRAKQSASVRGKPKSEAHRAAIAAAKKGKRLPPWTEERRAKMEAAWALRASASLCDT